ncbi:unnamed protein product [Periconia digitata]|uniref:Dihydroorotate dehydrogenase (fumarate) n=1 Tax=Periconia digitata TaxID=1303443 RepID=A0A9W4U2X6_9PLEO|nr:unnamed protein product [Periconia digitata]
MKQLNIYPRLLNSANPWCTTLEQLQELYSSEYTGAVTTRTSLLEGFPHDPSCHQYTFYNPATFQAAHANPAGGEEQPGSLNTLGYSPVPLKDYLTFIKTISDSLKDTPTSAETPNGRGSGTNLKPFIISITGNVQEVIECYRLISEHQAHVRMELAMEINLSCPNIPGKPPPAYNSATLLAYLAALKSEISRQLESVPPDERPSHIKKYHVPIGIKSPPYTYRDQYQQLLNALLQSTTAEPVDLPSPVSFITATNTLGSSLLLSPGLDGTFHHTLKSADGTSGIGGLAGAPLHPLALGNVYTIRKILSENSSLSALQIIGVGGVENNEGYLRMRNAGADAVGVGTALGRRGLKVFKEIMDGRID